MDKKVLSHLIIGAWLLTALAHGASIEVAPRYQFETTRILGEAVTRGDEKEVQRLLDSGADPGERWNAARDQIAFPFSLARSRPRLHRRLLGRCVEIYREGENCVGALFSAAYAGETGFVLRLLDKGASIDQTAHMPWTPLAGAAFKGRRKIVQLLLKRGADPDKALAELIEPMEHLKRAKADAETPLAIRRYDAAVALIRELARHRP